MFSLKQMEHNVIDLQKIEEETKKKIAAVNHQKVAIVKAFVAQMKVRINELRIKDLCMTTLHFIAVLGGHLIFFFLSSDLLFLCLVFFSLEYYTLTLGLLPPCRVFMLFLSLLHQNSTSDAISNVYCEKHHF